MDEFENEMIWSDRWRHRCSGLLCPLIDAVLRIFAWDAEAAFLYRMRSRVNVGSFLVLLVAAVACQNADERQVEKKSEYLNFSDELTASSRTQPSQAAISRSRETAITRAVNRVSNSVVGINVIQIHEFQHSIFEEDPFFNLFFPRRPYRRQVKSLGSGFIIDKQGYVLTNEHVVKNAVEVKVTLTDGTEHVADVIGEDEISDIALLKIRDPKNLVPVKFGNSENLLIGEWIIALGNPFGLFDLNAKPTVTVGVVSATNQDFGKLNEHVYKDMIQTDAAINQGNSGGPLVNALGEVIGMNTFIFTGEAGGRGGSIGLGFAIPSNRLLDIAKELREHGKINRNFSTGIEVDNLSPLVARFLKYSSTEGVVITDIQDGSAADKANLQVYDIILELEGEKVRRTEDIFNVINNLDLRGGDLIEFKIFREGKILTINLRLKAE